MRRTRQFRFVAALIALLSMLFMQLALASYACPNLQAGQKTEAVAMSPASGAESMPGCTGMGLDTEQPSLCHAHDQVGNQSLDKPNIPQVQPFVAVVLAQALVFVDPTFHPLSIEPRKLLLERVTAPPLAIRNCCFRI
jgi:hypothetical protein